MTKYLNTPEQARALLVTALRSGDYAQGRGQLRKENSGEYCCLGVACDVFHKAEDLGKWNGNTFGCQQGYHGSFCFLPGEVQEWLGFRETDGLTKSEESLMSFNDLYMETFEEIADRIEQGEVLLR